MPEGPFLALFLVLWVQVLSRADESLDTCSAASDCTSLILIQGASTEVGAFVEDLANQNQNAAKESTTRPLRDGDIASVPAKTRPVSIRRAQRQGWGRRRALTGQLMEAGDGRVGSRDLTDLRELAEDAEEEDEIEKEEASQRRLMGTGTDGIFDMPAWIPPLEPRVHDIRGCLLEGHPRGYPARLESPILVINLDSRHDRWAFVRNSSGLQDLHRDLRRVSAVHLRNMDDVEALQGKRKSDIMRKISSCSEGLAKRRNSPHEAERKQFFTVLSCYFSHLSAVQFLARNAVKKRKHATSISLVMEDDWEVHRDLLGMLPDIVRAVRHVHWDVIRLDCWGDGGWHPLRNVSSRRVMRTQKVYGKVNGFGGSHAILYRHGSLQKVLQYLEEEPLSSVDDMFWTDKIKSFCVDWDIVRHAQFGSDVSKTRGGPNMGGAVEPFGVQLETLTQAQREEHLKMCREQRSERSRLLKRQ